MKNIWIAICSLALFSLSAFSMQPSEDGESKSAHAGACEICQTPTNTKCLACPDAYYCSKEHQKKDWPKHKEICFGRKKNPAKKPTMPVWASPALRGYIEFCQRNPKTTAEGSFNDLILVLNQRLERDIVEIVQVALQNKPFAYNIETPSNQLKRSMAMGGFGEPLKNKESDPLWNEAIKFAEERGSIVDRYNDNFGSVILIVYNKKFRNNAQYFIDNKENPKQNGEDLEKTIISGLLLGYTPPSIRFYCSVNFGLPEKNAQVEKMYQDTFERAEASVKSIIDGK